MDKIAYLKTIDDVIAKGPYSATWSSLTNMELPSWFPKAKFGIFIHWGLYSIPAFGNEWYSKNMYVQGTGEFEHHIATYGPHKDFGYKDFIPMFTAPKFNPSEWADLFQEAGATYIVPVAEHHDGFQMYQSELSHFNAAEMGPKRDVLGELKQEFEKRNMIFATSSHRAEHLWFMGHGKDFDSDIKEPLEVGDFYWPSLQEQPTDNLDVHANPYPTEEYLTDWLLRTCELIDKYRPRILYFDWWIQHEGFKETLKKFTAYYYNRGVEWGTPVAVCYKYDAMAFGSAIVDVERGKFADTKPYYWQTDTATAKNSWGYTTNSDYKTPYELICYLVDVVSKNANLLLNVGPKGDGSIAEEDVHILKEMGAWLKINGEAIYNTKPWRYCSEGPTKEIEGEFQEGNSEYTSKDFRFTAGNGAIYATCLSYPEDGELVITSLALPGGTSGRKFEGILTEVSILGTDAPVTYELTKEGLKVHGPAKFTDYPVVVKIMTN